MAEEKEDFVSIGTPLEAEEDLKPRQRKAAVQAGQARAVAPWKQEVTDEQGRRRFHGAFTGGFSAGYFNTVGSKEGWAPSQFVSSRNSRADQKQKTAEDFMDEDELAALHSQSLGTSSEFDTFGGTAAELARRAAQEEAKKGRPAAIPGPVPDDLVVPAIESIGVKLLKKMGWRPGRGVGPKHEAATTDAKRKARKAMLAFSTQGTGPDRADNAIGNQTDSDDEPEVPKTTPSFVLKPKQDFYGLGFDPYKNAPEFRAAKRAKSEGLGSLFGPPTKRAPGFGLGALEGYGEEDMDIYDTEIPLEAASEEEEETDKAGSSRVPDLRPKALNALPGFKTGSVVPQEVQQFPPPVIPVGFKPTHKFPPKKQTTPVLLTKKVDPPKDDELQRRIDALAAYVARNGVAFEDLARERNMGDQKFSFLYGGNGHEYYLWTKKEVAEKFKSLAQDPNKKAPDLGSRPGLGPRLDAEARGRVLGEAQLPQGPVSVTSLVAPEDRQRLQSAMSAMFSRGETQDMGAVRDAKPFQQDPAKQQRYEEFLKEKSVGGLRRAPKDDGLTPAERAEERAEFERTASMLTQPAPPRAPLGGGAAPPPAALPLFDRFAESTASENLLVKLGGVLPGDGGFKQGRVTEDWRPAPLLCKRFGLPDPYAGRAPPEKPKSRTDALVLLGAPQAAEQKELLALPAPEEPPPEPPQPKELPPVEAPPDKPIDLFKAIFSDDESEEEKESVVGGLKAAEAANKVLNRQAANDFLAALGVEVPEEPPLPPIPVPPKPTPKIVYRAPERKPAKPAADTVEVVRKVDQQAVDLIKLEPALNGSDKARTLQSADVNETMREHRSNGERKVGFGESEDSSSSEDSEERKSRRKEKRKRRKEKEKRRDKHESREDRKQRKEREKERKRRRKEKGKHKDKKGKRDRATSAVASESSSED